MQLCFCSNACADSARTRCHGAQATAGGRRAIPHAHSNSLPTRPHHIGPAAEQYGNPRDVGALTSQSTDTHARWGRRDIRKQEVVLTHRGVAGGQRCDGAAQPKSWRKSSSRTRQNNCLSALYACRVCASLWRSAQPTRGTGRRHSSRLARASVAPACWRQRSPHPIFSTPSPPPLSVS